MVVGRVGDEENVRFDVGAKSWVGQRTRDETTHGGVCANRLCKLTGRSLSVLSSADHHDGRGVVRVQQRSNGANACVRGWNVKEVKPVFSDSVDEAAHVSTLLLSPDVDGVLLVGFSGHEQTSFFGHVAPQQAAHRPPVLNRFVADCLQSSLKMKPHTSEEDSIKRRDFAGP